MIKTSINLTYLRKDLQIAGWGVNEISVIIKSLQDNKKVETITTLGEYEKSINWSEEY
jgi:hypothetical protein